MGIKEPVKVKSELKILVDEDGRIFLSANEHNDAVVLFLLKVAEGIVMEKINQGMRKKSKIIRPKDNIMGKIAKLANKKIF